MKNIVHRDNGEIVDLIGKGNEPAIDGLVFQTCRLIKSST